MQYPASEQIAANDESSRQSPETVAVGLGQKIHELTADFGNESTNDGQTQKQQRYKSFHARGRPNDPKLSHADRQAAPQTR